MKNILISVLLVFSLIACVNQSDGKSSANDSSSTPIPKLVSTSTPTVTSTPYGSGTGLIYFCQINMKLGKDGFGSYPFDIYSIKTDGTNLVKLTNTQDKDTSYIQPAISPDGTKIAFVKVRFINDDLFGNHNASDLFLMNADGSNIQKLSSYPQFNGKDDISSYILESDPSWSPDGKKLAFRSNRHSFKPGNRNYDNEELYTLDIESNEIVQLTSSTGYIEHPTWSPDGQKIAFMSNRTGAWNIFVISSNGEGKAINITNNKFSNRFPSWSPVEDKIVFHSDRDGNIELYAMKSDGTDVVRLTNNPAFDASASWSPDGKWIAFISDRSGYEEIFILNVITNETIQLSNFQINSMNTNWKN